MLLRRPHPALLGPLVLSACWGKIRFDESEQRTPSDDGFPGSPSVAGAPATTSPIEPPVVHPPTPGAAGAPGSLPDEVDPRPPACTRDCCVPELTRLNPGEGPLDSDLLAPYLSGDGTSVLFRSRSSSLQGDQAGDYDEVYQFSLSDGRLTNVTRRGADLAPNGHSEPNGLSSDGRFVLITSWANNLGPRDENDLRDVYLYDAQTEEFTLVSASLAGQAGSGSSLGRDITPDGRYVVYSSSSSDLTNDDDNGAWDVFIWDRTTGHNERISMGPGDQQKSPIAGNHAHVSSDGRYVSFHSQSDALMSGDENGSFDIFIADRTRASTRRLSASHLGGETNGNAFVLGMSDDGRFLSSYAGASNLVADDENGENDVFLFDQILGTTMRINVDRDGGEAESGSNTATLSANGRFIGFDSSATRLTGQFDGIRQSFVYDTRVGTLTLISRSDEGVLGDKSSDAAHFSESGQCFIYTSRAGNLTADSNSTGLTQIYVGRWSAD